MKKKKIEKPFWERAYKGHAYWQSKKMLGKVVLFDGGYAWEAGGRKGTADELDKAKQAVEHAVFLADKQLDLFKE